MTPASPLPDTTPEPDHRASEDARAAEIHRALVDLRTKLESVRESLDLLEDEVRAATGGVAADGGRQG